jgi:rhomboid protease GluP
VHDPTARDDRPAWLREQQAAREAPDQGAPGTSEPGITEPGITEPGTAEPGTAEPGTTEPGTTEPRGPRHGAPAPSGTRLPTPYVTWSILAINTFMLLAIGIESGGGAGFVDPSSVVLCRLGALNATAIAEHGQWWRLLTVMFLHGGVIHFALNSWALWLFGPTLEFVLGRLRFLALYLVAGFAGSAASFGFGHTELGVGASGAIFGLLGALVAFFWRRRNAGASAQLRTLLIVLALNLVWGLSSPGIDVLAHLGGFVAGVLVMALLEVAAPHGRAARALALAAPVLPSLLLVAWGIAGFKGGVVDCASLPPGLV